MHDDFHPCPPRTGCPHCAASPLQPACDWSFLDGVYCISLRSRDDRARETMQELHRVGLCARTRFYRPEKDPGSANRGCWESHRAVAADARARGLRRVLILEDDVVFARGFGPSEVARIGAALAELPPDWMGFYLGHWALSAVRVSPRVLRCSSVCTHAYVASERLLAWLGGIPWSERRRVPKSLLGGKGIDTRLAALPQMFAVYPLVAFQRDTPGDHFRERQRAKRGLRARVRRSRVREWTIAHGMRANEQLILAITPLVRLGAAAWRGVTRFRAGIRPELPAELR